MNTMTIVKKTGLGIFVLFSALSIWYLFIKTNDFEVVINVKTAPGTAYHNILGWNIGLNKGKTKTVFSEKIPFKKLVHTYDFESYQLEFHWEMDKINDSITKISVGVNDLDRSVMTRIEKLFGTSPLEKLINQEFTGFNTELLTHLNRFSVEIEGEQQSPESYVAYVNILCDQKAKAFNMINNSTYINTYLKDNAIKLKSNPFVEIVDWNKNTGQLNFNFCFPIEKFDDFPQNDEVKYKKVIAKKSLKATFKGNYSYTDNAWYALYQHTIDKQIKPLNTITEVYYNNPHTDVKDVTWTAAIYMEIE